MSSLSLSQREVNSFQSMNFIGNHNFAVSITVISANTILSLCAKSFFASFTLKTAASALLLLPSRDQSGYADLSFLSEEKEIAINAGISDALH